MIERAAILSTGDELTTGKVVDTNSNYLADKLVEAGVEVAAVLTVGDVAERIIWAWQQAIEKADLIISTAGSARRPMISRLNWWRRLLVLTYSSLRKSRRTFVAFSLP